MIGNSQQLNIYIKKIYSCTGKTSFPQQKSSTIEVNFSKNKSAISKAQNFRIEQNLIYFVLR